MRTIKIVTDGSPGNTKITDADTGEEIKGVRKVIIKGEVGHIWQAVIWVNCPIVEVTALGDKWRKYAHSAREQGEVPRKLEPNKGLDSGKGQE